MYPIAVRRIVGTVERAVLGAAMWAILATVERLLMAESKGRFLQAVTVRVKRYL